VSQDRVDSSGVPSGCGRRLCSGNRRKTHRYRVCPFYATCADPKQLNRAAEAMHPPQVSPVSSINTRIWPIAYVTVATWLQLWACVTVRWSLPAAVTVDALRGLRIGMPEVADVCYLVLRLLVPEFTPVIVRSRLSRMPSMRLRRGRGHEALRIHEGRLLFERRELSLRRSTRTSRQLLTGLPLPLGGNVIARSLGARVDRGGPRRCCLNRSATR